MDLIYFVLVAFGLTQILVYGKVLENRRPTKGKLGELFKCPMCMGFHVGWFLVILSPFTELFSFDVSLINFLLLGSLSSGTSYIFNMVFGDNGIKYSQTMEITNNEQHMDKEVDASTS